MAEDDLDEDDIDGDEGEEGDEPSSGGKKKLFIIIGAVLFLLIGGGAAAFFAGLLDSLFSGAEETAEEGEVEGGDGAEDLPRAQRHTRRAHDRERDAARQDLIPAPKGAKVL